MSCAKNGYDSRSHARKELNRMRGQGMRGEGLRPYKCLSCDFWHLGHLPRSVLKGRMTRRDIYGESS